ncbi:uncharacterized protein BDV14DRAFT_210562 [Aspergillus stella-maris]|uniref:uncharacterized protein n=1 Tax=Aspergillus stella-maris TaxID=1810926 RepID=UPI003CCC97E2
MFSKSHSVAVSKRALLIGSPAYDLKGHHEFLVQECCGPQATKEGIIAAWENLVSNIRRDDTVLIYYSGHGCSVKDTENHSKRQFQFIVPNDYVPEFSPGDFKGIFDIELSQLVHRTTAITANVTVILDCCFSGRMARDPAHGARAAYDQIVNSILSHLTSLERNQHAVRIVAAADPEPTFEYDEGNGRMVGAFTKALLTNLDYALQEKLTWKHLMLRLSDLVESQFPYLHPHVEGPCNRVVFSQQEQDTNVYNVKITDKVEHILQVGETAGVKVGNTFKILHNMTAETYNMTAEETKGLKEPRGTVISVSAFDALKSPMADILRQYVNIQISEMKFIQLPENMSCMIFANLDQQGETVCLKICGEQRATFDIKSDGIAGAVSKALCMANSISRAAHLLSFKPTDGVKLDHRLQTGFSKVKTEGHGTTIIPIEDSSTQGPATEDLATDGTTNIVCKDRICITLHNIGVDNIYVSVFNVTAAARICLLSRSSPRVIRLCSGSQYVLGKEQHTGVLKGMEMRWPKGIDTDVGEAIPEWFVCFVTDGETDFRCLEKDLSTTRSPPEQRGDPSRLEKIAYQLSYGQGRDSCCEEDSDRKWDITIVPFSLSS